MYNFAAQLAYFYFKKIRKMSLPRDVIRFAVEKNYHKIAAVDRGREISYGKLYERAKKLANALSALKINKGDKLAVLIYNCQEYFEIRIAAYITGIVLVPLIWDLDLETAIFILNDCRVKALIYHPGILGKDIEIIKERTGINNFIPISSEKEKGSYEQLLAGGSDNEFKIELLPGDLASINFSSGTTGRPKGVMLTHDNWMASFYNYIANSPKLHKDNLTLLHILSFSTAGGTAFLPALMRGAKNIMIQKFSEQEASSLILKYQVNAFFTSPSFFLSLMDYCKINQISFSLLGIMVGTEAMPQEKFKEAIEFFGPIIQQGYGMVEILPPLTLLCSKDYLSNKKLDSAKLLSVGRVLKGVAIDILDESNEPLPPGRIGRIVLKSCTLSRGYWQRPELTAKAYRDGFFFSNDFGYLDESGYLYLLGRREDIIKKETGNIIFARQIEEILHKHPQVLMVNVFRNQEGKIIAFVSLKTGAENLGSQELLKFCADPSGKGIRPDTIIILNKMPINASGKIDRKQNRAYFKENKNKEIL